MSTLRTLPGCAPFDDALAAQLQPHAASNSGYVNRLALADSPYLRQHADNPVNWHTWDDLPFAQARATDRPLFISIGYATCHWCHVMARESFADEAVAHALNAAMVSIKLDREVWPTVDAHYMSATQIISGHGGWPMSVFALPDGRPFFAATYFTRAQFLDLIARIDALWHNQRAQLEEQAARLESAIARHLNHPDATAPLAGDIRQHWRSELLQLQDRRHGGFAGAPKFPQEPWLQAAQQRAAFDRDVEAGNAVTQALHAMRLGGIHDHLGGGFHRYATDAAWRVPHFEKMLYNQAQLSLLYLRAWLLSGSTAFRSVCTTTLEYVLSDLRRPDGLFCSGSDADADGVEGLSFTWDAEQVRQALSAVEWRLACQMYGLDGAPELDGRHVLVRRGEPEDGAAVRALHERLRALRTQHPQPRVDDKAVTAWNAMTIKSLAEAGWLMQRRDWLQAAQESMQVLLKKMLHPERGLLRCRWHGDASAPATLSDHAWVLDALVSLYDGEADARWLDAAQRVHRLALQHHCDPQSGLMHNNRVQHDAPLALNNRSGADGATPSGNGQWLLACARLQRRGTIDLRTHIEQQTAALAAAANAHPLAHSTLLCALDVLEHGEISPLQHLPGHALSAHTQARQGALEVTLKTHGDARINAAELRLADTPDAEPLAGLSAADEHGLEIGTLRVADFACSELTRLTLRVTLCRERVCAPAATLTVLALPGLC